MSFWSFILICLTIAIVGNIAWRLVVFFVGLVVVITYEIYQKVVGLLGNKQ